MHTREDTRARSIFGTGWQNQSVHKQDAQLIRVKLDFNLFGLKHLQINVGLTRMSTHKLPCDLRLVSI